MSLATPHARALRATRTFRRWYRYHRPKAAAVPRGSTLHLTPEAALIGAWLALVFAAGAWIASGGVGGYLALTALGIAGEIIGARHA